MTSSESALYRLHNQKISTTKFVKPEEVISWMLAIQGQDYQGAKWSIGLRTMQCTNNDIEKAFHNKSILRTWLMRGTLHLVTAEDIHWIQSLVSDRIIKACTRRYKELELDTQTLIKTNDILANILAKVPFMDRRHLLDTLNINGISTEGQRAAYILQRASLDGLIVQGNTSKNSPVYYSMNHIDAKTIPPREDCLRELAFRYFRSRGPASLADFGWWTGLTVKDLRTGLENCRHQLQAEIINGFEYFHSSSGFTSPTSPIVHLLPGFDEFLIAYKDRCVSLDPAHARLWCPGNNGMFLPFITINGVAKGLWKKKQTKTGLTIEPTFFESFDQPEEEIFNAIQKYLHYNSSN